MCVYAPEFIITRCGDAKLSRDAAAESGIAPRAGPSPARRPPRLHRLCATPDPGCDQGGSREDAVEKYLGYMVEAAGIDARPLLHGLRRSWTTPAGRDTPTCTPLSESGVPL